MQASKLHPQRFLSGVGITPSDTADGARWCLFTHRNIRPYIQKRGGLASSRRLHSDADALATQI